ncbi:MAG: molybdopterin molybdenumtransferase MoeA [Hyphomicrobiales bacterium]|nr:MAG: molybdopterin molybdenumtransferase MoeA [Hyphomicrobiales bacterium]
MSLLPVATARQNILSAVKTLPTEQVALDDAHLRVCAEDLRAQRTQPPFPSSAMDGYAVRHSDMAKPEHTLTVIGEAAAGHVFEGNVGAGQAVRIFTGAPVPEGADTILIQEDAEIMSAGNIRATEVLAKGAFIRKAGLDFNQGDVLIQAHTQLRSAHMALLASMNMPQIPVVKKPRIGVLATGDELVMPGEDIGPGQIVASNNFGIAARIRELGGIPIPLGIAKDTEASLMAALEQARAAHCDAIVTLGGASVGTHDLVQSAFEKQGLNLNFWKIAMRPGKPLMFGNIGDMLFIGLPGNPVSSMVCTELFLVPMIRKWLGQNTELSFIKARLTCDLRQNDRREDYLRATLSPSAVDDSLPDISPFEKQDSSMLATFTKAGALIKRAPHAPPAAKGDIVDVLLL